MRFGSIAVGVAICAGAFAAGAGQASAVPTITYVPVDDPATWVNEANTVQTTMSNQDAAAVIALTSPQSPKHAAKVLNPLNPMNPGSPLNPLNPANPNSLNNPFNPNNPNGVNNPQNPGSPLYLDNTLPDQFASKNVNNDCLTINSVSPTQHYLNAYKIGPDGKCNQPAR